MAVIGNIKGQLSIWAGWKTTVCHPDRKVHRNGLCWFCYRMSRASDAKYAGCHRSKLVYAGDLCKNCYQKQAYNTNYHRAACHPDLPHHGRDYCRDCFHRDAQLRKKYGLSLRTWSQQLASQDGKCALCGKGFSTGNAKPVVDHDHHTGKFRGIICNGCNSVVGHARDDVGTLEKAIQYLRRSQ